MYGFPLAISCCLKISNIPSKFVKYIDVPLFKAVTLFVGIDRAVTIFHYDYHSMSIYPLIIVNIHNRIVPSYYLAIVVMSLPSTPYLLMEYMNEKELCYLSVHRVGLFHYRSD